MRGINSETGESVCAKINHNMDFEGSPHQVTMHSILEPGEIELALSTRSHIFLTTPLYLAGNFSDLASVHCRPSADASACEDQKKEAVLHAAMKHENVVEVKDIVIENILNYWIRPPPNLRPMLIVRSQSDLGALTKQARVTQFTAWQIIMELVEGGELFSEVVDNGGLPLDDRGPEGSKIPGARSYARQILLGLAYCHKRSIAHRDIKLENLLLSADRQTCKIADFGLAKISSGLDKTILGTIKCVPASTSVLSFAGVIISRNL